MDVWWQKWKSQNTPDARRRARAPPVPDIDGSYIIYTMVYIYIYIYIYMVYIYIYIYIYIYMVYIYIPQSVRHSQRFWGWNLKLTLFGNQTAFGLWNPERQTGCQTKL